MIRQIFVQIPTEQILEEWADRVKQEDLQNFVNVFVTAKKKRRGSSVYYQRFYWADQGQNRSGKRNRNTDR